MRKLIFLSSFCLLTAVMAFSQECTQESPRTLKILDYPESFNSLISPFKGKVIYIDLMASWCKPCIAELQAAKQLETYFDSNNIVRLYISIDNKEDIEKAIRILQKDSLKGYFISYHPIKQVLNTTFPREMESLFLKDEKGNMSISIPRYAIVNKRGEIAEKRAERPANAVLLKEQLEIYLKD